MPNIEPLYDSASQIITNYQTESQFIMFLYTMNLKYDYSKNNFRPDTAKHCDFNIVSGDNTGPYRFKTGFYGLTYMTAELQKTMDYTLISLKKPFCCSGDILIVKRAPKKIILI